MDAPSTSSSGSLLLVGAPRPFRAAAKVVPAERTRSSANLAPLQKRLQKELLSMQKEPPPGVSVDIDNVGSNLTQWTVDMEGAKGTLYEGEKFQLLFKFTSKYPFDSPEVTFLGPNIPVHPHVYSNGHICLSILTDDWSPALSVQSVCLSIVSMLSSCKEKKRPPDNSLYVKTCNKNPKKTKWWYHVGNNTTNRTHVCARIVRCPSLALSSVGATTYTGLIKLF
ncbi:hypothetical protein HPB48_020461 [Haemaphysalis longicornis]|uniref:N-terminal E2 ubiquitin-conjugating enzyme n=1 Tax=Haemaphysalis longicornis TaxID=44386 RepID=A0A9J6FLN1_HAELO|nr:hypothetical protein HPB48_020461 [Haemaphysalis longicornis]